MSLINVDKISFNGDLAKAIWGGLKSFFTTQPAWLRTTLICAVVIWIFYYTYNFFNRAQSIQELQNEVELINEKMNGILSKEKYQENLIYVIAEIQLLQQAEKQSYEDELLQIELSVNFIKRYHPGDPTIRDLEAMKSRLIVNHEVYQQHYDHVMKQLKEAATDTVN